MVHAADAGEEQVVIGNELFHGRLLGAVVTQDVFGVKIAVIPVLPVAPAQAQQDQQRAEQALLSCLLRGEKPQKRHCQGEEEAHIRPVHQEAALPDQQQVQSPKGGESQPHRQETAPIPLAAAKPQHQHRQQAINVPLDKEVGQTGIEESAQTLPRAGRDTPGIPSFNDGVQRLGGPDFGVVEAGHVNGVLVNTQSVIEIRHLVIIRHTVVPVNAAGLVIHLIIIIGAVIPDDLIGGVKPGGQRQRQQEGRQEFGGSAELTSLRGPHMVCQTVQSQGHHQRRAGQKFLVPQHQAQQQSDSAQQQRQPLFHAAPFLHPQQHQADAAHRGDAGGLGIGHDQIAVRPEEAQQRQGACRGRQDVQPLK